jgi:hypothetical protein
MPRRNRNAQAPRIDTDELATQADQLTTEFGQVNGTIVYLTDEIQPYSCSAGTGGGKTNPLREHIAQFISKYPGCQITITDAKGVTSNAS